MKIDGSINMSLSINFSSNIFYKNLTFPYSWPLNRTDLDMWDSCSTRGHSGHIGETWSSPYTDTGQSLCYRPPQRFQMGHTDTLKKQQQTHGTKKHKLPSDFYLSELVTTLNIQKPVLFTQGI